MQHEIKKWRYTLEHTIELYISMGKNFRFVGFFLLLFPLLGQAQKGYELGGWLGLSQYYGDLNTSINIKKPGIAGGLNARYNFNNRLSTKASLNYGRIAADDDLSNNNFERRRNLDFKSNIFDFTAVGEFNFFDYKHGSKLEFWTPYVGLGFSVFRYNPTTKLGDTKYSLRDFGTEGQAVGEEYLLFSGGATLTGGVKWDLNRDWSMNAEISLRKLFTDYIDDVSTVYTDKNTLRTRRGDTAVLLSDKSIDSAISTPGSQRGNSKDNDTYVFIGISIMRYFGDIPCPKVSKN